LPFICHLMAHTFSIVRDNVLLERVFAELYVLRRLNGFDQPWIAVRLARMPMVQTIMKLLLEGIKERNISHVIPRQLFETFGVIEGEA